MGQVKFCTAGFLHHKLLFQKLLLLIRTITILSKVQQSYKAVFQTHPIQDTGQ